MRTYVWQLLGVSFEAFNIPGCDLTSELHIAEGHAKMERVNSTRRALGTDN